MILLAYNAADTIGKSLKSILGGIAFCDADDWYDDNFWCEHHRHIIQYHADISQCRTQHTEALDFGNSDDIEIIEDDLVRKYLQYQSVNVSLCDKLYRRELLYVQKLKMNSDIQKTSI